MATPLASNPAKAGFHVPWVGFPVLLVVAFLGACSAPPADAPPAKVAQQSQPLTLMTGPSGGAYSPLGHALADVYNAKVAGVHVTATTIDGPEGAGANAKALEAGQ